MAQFVRACAEEVGSWLGLQKAMEGMDSMDVTPSQQEPLRDDQVVNNAGGFGWEVSDRDRLHRFLCLGSEGGTYYVKEQKLAKENAMCIQRLIDSGHGEEVVADVVKFSVDGRTAKQEPILFSLAMCARDQHAKTKELAYDALPKVCRIPTHLFTFVEYTQALSKGKGWGRAQRRAVEKWYKSRPAKSLAMAVTKYQQRNGWTHRDLARLSHLQAHTRAHACVFRYMVRGYEEAFKSYGPASVSAPAHAEPHPPSTNDADADETTDVKDASGACAEGSAAAAAMDVDAKATGTVATTTRKAKTSVKQQRKAKAEEALVDNVKELGEVITFLTAVETMKTASHEEQVVSLIKDHGLVREHVPTEFLNSAVVWAALLSDMPMTAMLRNLAKMTSIGLLTKANVHTKTVCQRLSDRETLRRARIHPFQVLLALETYRSGRGLRGKQYWEPLRPVTRALESAFYAAFHAVEPTGKRFLLAMDVSGSMWGATIMDTNISAAKASACMAMVTARTEEHHHFVAFSHKLVDLRITADMSLEAVDQAMNQISMGGTDCAQPMIYAQKKKLQVDVFIVYTDCETWAGKVHPAEALKRYRRTMNMPNAKLIVVGMTSGGFTIADPKDRNMLDMVGFDSAAPGIIHDFSMGAF